MRASLGSGGIERWVVYSLIVRLLALGGYVFASAADESFPNPD